MDYATFFDQGRAAGFTDEQLTFMWNFFFAKPI